MKDKDNIFLAKQKINTILDKLDGETVSFGEVDKATAKLSKFDKKILLDILIKRLESEKQSSFFIANYMLREFGDESVVENIVKIVFEKQIPDEKKAILISLLDSLNVDLSELNLTEVFDDIEDISKKAIEGLLEDINNDYITLDRAIEWLYEVPQEARFSFIDTICQTANEKAFKFIQNFLISDDNEIVERILNNLSKQSNPLIIDIIKESIPYMTNQELLNLAERILRKFSFKGIEETVKKGKQKKEKGLGEVYKILMTNIDGVGSQSLWFSRYFGKKIECMFLLLNEKKGIKDCFGNKMTVKQFESMVKHNFDEDVTIVEIDYEKALNLIKDALYINKQNKILVSPSFHFLRSTMLEEKIITPEPYTPVFDKFNLEKIKNDIKLTNNLETILDISECESWFIINDSVYEFAEKLLAKKKNSTMVKPTKKELNEFISTNLISEIPNLKKRLFLTADLFNSKKDRTKALESKIKMLLCAALNIDNIKPEENGFINAIALESLFQAQMSLLTGFDFRANPDY